jgi:hypothetical protein
MEQQEQEEHTRLAQSDRDIQSSLMSIEICSKRALAGYHLRDVDVKADLRS